MSRKEPEFVVESGGAPGLWRILRRRGAVTGRTFYSPYIEKIHYNDVFDLLARLNKDGS